MPNQETLSVAERFVSLNGEGRYAGRLSTFLRFAGCNLHCSYCDTAWANLPDCPVDHLTVAEAVGYVVETKTACVTLTGGEPLIQPAMPRLVEALLAIPERDDLIIEIETNGATDITPVALVRQNAGEEGRKVTFTIDYKLASSGMEADMLAANFEQVQEQDTVKFVVGSQEDLEDMLGVVRAYNLHNRCSIYLSPVFGKIDPADIAEFMRDHLLNKATLQLQLHKIIWPNREKGV